MVQLPTSILTGQHATWDLRIQDTLSSFYGNLESSHTQGGASAGCHGDVKTQPRRRIQLFLFHINIYKLKALKTDRIPKQGCDLNAYKFCTKYFLITSPPLINALTFLKQLLK